jgi:hypothetical protein
MRYMCLGCCRGGGCWRHWRWFERRRQRRRVGGVGNILVHLRLSDFCSIFSVLEPERINVQNSFSGTK